MKPLQFEFTIEESNTLLAGLQELPFKVAKPVIDKMISQYNEQIKPKEEENKPE